MRNQIIYNKTIKELILIHQHLTSLKTMKLSILILSLVTQEFHLLDCLERLKTNLICTSRYKQDFKQKKLGYVGL